MKLDFISFQIKLSCLGFKSELLGSYKEQPSTNQDSQTKDSVLGRKMTFKDKVEMKANSIIKNINEINGIKSRLRKDFVPSVVITNLNQTIKDLDVGIKRQVVFLEHGFFLILKTK